MIIVTDFKQIYAYSEVSFTPNYYDIHVCICNMIYKYTYKTKSYPQPFSVCILLYVVLIKEHSKYLLKCLDNNNVLYANILPGFIVFISILRHTVP